MRRDFQIAILLALAAIPAGVALMVAPEYVPILKEYPAPLFWGGLVLAAILIGAAIIIAFRGEATEPKPGHRRRVMALVVIVVFVFGFLGSEAIHFWPHPAGTSAMLSGAKTSPAAAQSISIHPLFADAYGEFQLHLGKPKSMAIPASGTLGEDQGAAEVIFADAILVWNNKEGVSRVFPRNHPADEPFSFDDEMKTKWESDTAVSKLLCSRIPQLCNKACRPPQGGSVEYFRKNPQQWLKVGCREWICILDARTTYIQHFEKGVIVGPLRTADKSSAVGQVVVSYEENGKRYSSMRHAGDAPKCTKEVTDFGG